MTIERTIVVTVAVLIIVAGQLFGFEGRRPAIAAMHCLTLAMFGIMCLLGLIKLKRESKDDVKLIFAFHLLITTGILSYAAFSVFDITYIGSGPTPVGLAIAAISAASTAWRLLAPESP